jgi:hypothetical protein
MQQNAVSTLLLHAADFTFKNCNLDWTSVQVAGPASADSTAC